MPNLLRETIKVLEDNNKSPEDVLYVACTSNEAYRRGTWKDFERLADQDYHAGYGIEEVNLSLVVVGPGWWLERSEYDGSEWWEFKKQPRKPSEVGLKEIFVR